MTVVKPSVVWLVSGSDSGGGAGMQADLHTCHDLDVHPCSIITAITAQNSQGVTDTVMTPPDCLNAQFKALKDDIPPKAIKVGMLGDKATILVVSRWLSHFKGQIPIVCDPVMVSTSGDRLMVESGLSDFIEHILPYVDILTPNLPEAEQLVKVLGSGELIHEEAVNMVRLARQIVKGLGVKSVLLKGGHRQFNASHDFFYSPSLQCWLGSELCAHNHTHGAGCSLSSAIAACIALGYDIADALVIAKFYISQAIRLAYPLGQGVGPVAHRGWPTCSQDLPYVVQGSDEPAVSRFDIVEQDVIAVKKPSPVTVPGLVFPNCGSEPIGFYPIVDSILWLERLVDWGGRTVQLRIKDQSGVALSDTVKEAIALGKKYNLRLFINDYWELAIRWGAYGVHLGEDLERADIGAIYKAGLRLGISTHCHYEVARAWALQPSYIAYGPIYATSSKSMRFSARGLERLSYWRSRLPCALVAIGGISYDRLPSVLATGVDGVAVINAVMRAKEPEWVVKQSLLAFSGRKEVPNAFIE